MYVRKISGKLEKFNPKKIERTAIRAGASRELAREVAAEVRKHIHEGIATKEVYKLALKLLREKPEVAKRYTLKRAIMHLGPTGFIFEKYVAYILKEYGYETRINAMVKGKCVTHEVDIIAKKDKTYMIECKYHNELGIYTDIKTAMYTYARSLDLKENVDQGWLISNTKCSNKAKEYAKCVNLKITTWNYPKESLQRMIKEKRLYPITILKSVNRFARNQLVEHNILTLKELLKYSTKELRLKTRLSETLLKKILEEAKNTF